MKIGSRKIDQQVFDRLVKFHSDKVYSIALYTVQDEMAAEDITQDVFIKIYKGLSRFRGAAKISTWIYRITKNTCYNYLKREKKYANISGLDSSGNLQDDSPRPEEEFIQADQHNRLREAVGQLPPNLRMAITLYYFHEHSYEEVAKIMDIPLNTLKSHIHRGKQQLAGTLSYAG